MLQKDVGRNSLNVYLSFDGFLRRVVSLLQAGGFIYIALAWRHRFFLSKILSAFFTRSLGIRSCILSRWPHLQNWFSFTLFPLMERRCHFRFRVLANHFASIFFLPLSGDSVGLLYVPIPHSLPTQSQNANICWFPFWPGFVTSAERDWPRFLSLS